MSKRRMQRTDMGGLSMWRNGWFLLLNPLYGTAVPPKADGSANFAATIVWPDKR